MGIKTYRPYTPSRRHMTGSDFSEVTKKSPEKSLLAGKKKTAGRNNQLKEPGAPVFSGQQKQRRQDRTDGDSYPEV